MILCQCTQYNQIVKRIGDGGSFFVSALSITRQSKDQRWRVILCQCTQYSQLIKGLEMSDDSVSVHLVQLASQRIGHGRCFCVSALSIASQSKDWRWRMILCQCIQYRYLVKRFDMTDDSVLVHLVQLPSQEDWRWRIILFQCTQYNQIVKGLEMADDSVSVHLVQLASQKIGDGG